MSNRPGKTIIADYELGHVISHGRHSKLYYAVDSTSGEAVAVKELDWKNIPLTERAETRREVAAMLCLNHPNIVRMHDVIATTKNVYLIMEYVEGPDLAGVLKNQGGKFREDVARKLFRQLINAVGYFHRKGLIHRNLKLQNLFVDVKGNLKVSGFRLCAFVPGDRGDGVGLRRNVGGGLEYAAPEMLLKRGGYDGKKADVWSCGVILYVMLTGRFPFETTNLAVYLRRISRAEFEMPALFSDELERLFQMLLEPEPLVRVCIPGLMRYPWISRGLEEGETPIKLEVTDKVRKREETESPLKLVVGREGEVMFRAKLGMREVLDRLEEVGMDGGFSIWRSEWTVKMLRPEPGRVGRLGLSAEVFEMSESLILVKVWKTSGERVDFEKFVEKELRPRVKDIALPLPRKV